MQYYAFTSHSFQVDSGECLLFSIWPSLLLKKIFGVVLFLLEFFIPLVILIYCYGKIVWILTRRVDSNTNSENLNLDNFQLAKTNTIKTMFTVALFFVICISLGQIYFLMANLGFNEDWNGTYYKFTMIMSFLNCTVNPFIYLFKYQDFHKALMNSLGCIKFKEVKKSQTGRHGTFICNTISASVRG